MQNDKQNLSIKSEWEKYLSFCFFTTNLSEEKKYELKATFYAGCGAMKNLIEDNLAYEQDENRGVELMIGWDEEINDFAEQHIIKVTKKLKSIHEKFNL